MIPKSITRFSNTDNHNNSTDDLYKYNFLNSNYERNENQRHKEKLCKFYKKGICKHGIKGQNCKYDHPKTCRKLLMHGNKGTRGCKEGRDCNDFHPRMCANSIKMGECYQQNCPFMHIKGTKRIQKPSSNQKGNQLEKRFYEKNENQNQKIIEDKSKDFLDHFHNFKQEIMEAMDIKVTTMISLIQNHNQQKNYHMNPVNTLTQTQIPTIVNSQKIPMNTQSHMNYPMQGTHQWMNPQLVPNFQKALY